MEKNLIKICILGDFGVGKRTYLSYLRKGKYIDFSKMRISWGAPGEIMKQNIDGKDYSIFILYNNSAISKVFFERGKFEPFTDLFFKGTSGILFMYDSTNRISFENIKNYIIRTVEIIQNKKVNNRDYNKLGFVLPIKLMLVGNKKDLISKSQISIEEGQKMADTIGRTSFYETSCITGENVFESFKALFRECLNR